MDFRNYVEGTQGIITPVSILFSWKSFDHCQEGLTTEDVLALGTEDDARKNAERLQRFWEEEVETCKLANEGKEEADKVKPSLPKVNLDFASVQLNISFTCLGHLEIC